MGTNPKELLLRGLISTDELEHAYHTDAQFRAVIDGMVNLAPIMVQTALEEAHRAARNRMEMLQRLVGSSESMHILKRRI